ncbi:hypothetical protein BE18_27715 [Sorangium cellulosum]|uniref:Uncharacterized protein n=1 Tax=Sorangium cellulosum TaxID=56 RepID=A0A150RLT4_SORCE|nr:hypothetical protein BE18_27715 [Sorangium cellulosum]
MTSDVASSPPSSASSTVRMSPISGWISGACAGSPISTRVSIAAATASGSLWPRNWPSSFGTPGSGTSATRYGSSGSADDPTGSRLSARSIACATSLKRS